MKLLSRDQIESLAKFRSNSLLTTSFYFDTSKNKLTMKEIRLSLKNLINTNKSRLEAMKLSKVKRESLHQDLKRIQEYCDQNLNSYSHAGLAIFSCSEKQFWQVYDLVNSPKNMIVFDHNPYVRPLSAIINEYHRICVLTLDRKEAKWYDIFMGEISLLQNQESDVPSKVREGGWEGYESKRIERHIASRLHNHFNNAAKLTFDLYNAKKFDWLFLGCSDEYYKDLIPLLHPYIKKRLRGRIKVKPGDSSNTIIQKALPLKQKLKNQERNETLQNFITELNKNGLAVSGLKNTLRRLNRGEVQTLLITRQFSKPGRYCEHCDFLFVDEARCPACQRKTTPLVDIIDEAVEAAIEKGGRVVHLLPPSGLKKYGDIGALLRYKT
jgi:peptide subunit release factor 1 (eRF1)